MNPFRVKVHDMSGRSWKKGAQKVGNQFGAVRTEIMADIDNER